MDYEKAYRRDPNISTYIMISTVLKRDPHLLGTKNMYC